MFYFNNPITFISFFFFNNIDTVNTSTNDAGNSIINNTTEVKSKSNDDAKVAPFESFIEEPTQVLTYDSQLDLGEPENDNKSSKYAYDSCSDLFEHDNEEDGDETMGKM